MRQGATAQSRPPVIGYPTTAANTSISPLQNTATTTYTGSTVPLAVARRQQQNTPPVKDTRPRKEGWVAVREGGFVQPWKQRFMILRNEWVDFAKAEDGKTIYTLFLNEIVRIGRAETGVPTIEISRKQEGSSTSPGEKEGPLKILHIKPKSEAELYNWIDFIHIACPNLGGVSNPTNFFHEVHVGFDAAARQFVGLPQEWVQLLSASAITKDDYARNPQAVIEAVDFYSDLQNQSENPEEYFALSPTRISRIEEDLGPNDAPSPPRDPVAPPRIDERPNVPLKNDASKPGEHRSPPLAPKLPVVPVWQYEEKLPDAAAKREDKLVETSQATVQEPKQEVNNSVKNTITPLAVPSRRRQTLRHVTTSEAELLARLQPLVSEDDPNISYQKHKKIGQGVSGSVYVATIRTTAVGIGRQIATQKGPKTRVAIKEMNLARQHRKEALIDEITIMKEGKHKNVINFLDAFLVNDNRVLWVVMDYMDGGALIDIIDNNPEINERHIATICREVS